MEALFFVLREVGSPLVSVAIAAWQAALGAVIGAIAEVFTTIAPQIMEAIAESLEG